MLKKRFISPLLMAAVVSLFSCVDNDYDLSNIDSTIGVDVKDLIVPINFDDITLDAILDLNEGSQVQKVNGEYAIVESGTFHSEQINVPSFTITNLGIKPIEDKIEIEIDVPTELLGGNGMKSRTTEDDQLLFSYKISDAYTDIRLHEDAKGVSDFIVAIEEIGVTDAVRKGQKAEMKVTLGFNGLENFATELEIEDLKLQFLSGLKGTFSMGEYDKKTGVLNIGNRKTIGHKLELSVEVDKIDSDAGYELKDGSFTLNKMCRVSDGHVAVYGRNLTAGYRNADGSLNIQKLQTERPREIIYRCIPKIGDIYVKDFTGRVKYDINGINISPVELNDIPDVLNQTGTKIRLDNPQIYLQLNNPVYTEYGLTAETNLKITSYVGGTPSSFYPDNGGVDIKKADNKFCLSPKDPESFYQGYVEGDNGETVRVDFTEGTEMVRFTKLSDVLCGEGVALEDSKLPEKIEIDVVDPKMAEQHVENFRLGENIGSVDGEWVFYAPLLLTEDSRIKYTDTFDGWNDEDVDAIVITKLVINAEVTTDVPLDLVLTAYPIDKDGKKILDAEGKTISGTANVSHTSDKTPLTIEIVGEIKHLDGIILDAFIHGTDENLSLTPVQTIKLDNVRAKVSGTYEKEL